MRRAISIRLAVWAGEQRYGWPLVWFLARVWWPIWRVWAFEIKWRMGRVAWVIRCFGCRVFRLGCPVHRQPRIGGVACPLCLCDDLLRRVRVGALRPSS